MKRLHFPAVAERSLIKPQTQGKVTSVIGVSEDQDAMLLSAISGKAHRRICY